MNRRVSRKTLLTSLIVILLIPAAIYAGWRMGTRSFYLTSAAVMVLAMIPFFVSFESRRPQARELVVLAVMSAIAVASRAAFAALPSFKPLVGIVIITAMAFGAQAGFLTGAISGFVSNFIFGQGPWTPWQMFAFGMAGFLAGLLQELGVLPKKNKWPVVIYGGLVVMLVVGPLLDTCSLFLTAAIPSAESAGAVYLSGIPFNAVHAVATVVTLILLYRPLMDKLERIRVKYGMMEACDET